MTTRETELLAANAALELEVASLRSVMADVIKAHGYAGGTPIEVMSTPFTPTALEAMIAKAGEEPGISWGKADKVLSTPFTPTALLELIEKAEKMTIERCAEVHKDAASKTFSASGIVWADKFEREIRALPVGQIELEELL